MEWSEVSPVTGYILVCRVGMEFFRGLLFFHVWYVYNLLLYCVALILICIHFNSLMVHEAQYRISCLIFSLCPIYPCFVSLSSPTPFPPPRSTVLQQQFNKVVKVETGSVALPAIMRSGAGGPESFQMGSMPQAKQHITSGQMHRGHMPPLVRPNVTRSSKCQHMRLDVVAVAG